MTAVLEARGLACGYAAPVLEQLDFAIAPGEFVGILGPNGTGKSTLLKTVARLLPPHAGQLTLFGTPLERYDARALALKAAFVPQELPPDAGWRVHEIVGLGRFPHQRGWGFASMEDRRAVAEAIVLCGLDELRERTMETLSGGQRQRVYLARAIAQGAPLLLFDEPTSHLDISHQLDFFRLVGRSIQERGVTVVAVLHDLNMAAQFCDRLLVVKEGLLLADGPPETVIVPELVEAAFGLQVEVRRHAQTGRPYILPLLRRGTGLLAGSGRLRGQPRARLHALVGGGAGDRLLPELYRMGYEVGVGVINMLDSDQVLAARLGMPAITEAPFSPASDASLALLGEQLRAAQAVVVGNVAFGSGNVANLRVLLEQASERAIFLLADQAIADRDFTGGEATALWNALVENGARVLSQQAFLAQAREGRL
ncbi:MAG TPA: ABC transporter ATP-binding protein [Oscillatoriaceae cyanobacterium]